MKFRNKKTGEVIEGTEQEMEEVFSELEKTGEIVDWEEYKETVSVPVSNNSGKTSPQERADYFRGTPAAFAAQLFPNLAERNMQGKDGFNLGTVRAGIADVASLPGRALAGINNAVLGDGTFDLGRRAGEDTGFIETIARDPTTPIVAGAGKALAGGIKAASNAGKYLLGNTLGRPTLGRVAGGAIGGAAEGAGIEAASAGLNDREITPTGLAVGAGLGGVFEGLGTGAQMMLQKYGKNFVKSAAQALRLGNTDRPLTDSELKAFLSDERNVSALRTVLDKGSEGRNMTPFVNDRGKSLEPVIEQSRVEAVSTLKNEPSLDGGFAAGVREDIPPTQADMQRRMNALNAPKNSTEIYYPKTIYREGKKNALDMAYAPDVTDGVLYAAPRRSNAKVKTYESNSQYNLEKFADKYDNISSQISKNVHGGPITPDESKLLDQLVSEVSKDTKIISGYNPEYVISANKFLGDRIPFNNGFLDNVVGPFIDSHQKGVSSEFIQEFNRIVGNAKGVGQSVSDNLRNTFSGKEKAVLERAFAYSDADDITVKKGYKKAVDRFADTLSDYADSRVGRPGTNAKGEEYVVGQDKMKKYAYSYLAKVQEAIGKRGALDANEIVTLYGLATNVNDKVVQDAIIQLLRDLKVPAETVERFKQVGGNYAMLNKARTRMKKNANEDNPLKGTMAAPIYPQEGFNAANAVGWRFQGGNINLGDLSTTNNSTRIGRGIRQAVYNLGLPYARTRE